MLQLDALTVRFGGLTAVDAITLTTEKHEVLGLVGPNGAGKTTLFNAVSGLVRPSAGRIAFDSVNLLNVPLHRRARMGIGRTFQIPQPLHELTVRENLIVAQPLVPVVSMKRVLTRCSTSPIWEEGRSAMPQRSWR